ncbi:MAG: hypothetical protein CM1200mP2_43980 [Planctomycetaceae bacterium]|nr:MAG: hypothetical protein CM1200mP2_43980 [Planctomycetaceae bacterium]
MVGSLEADRDVEIRSRVSGRIEELAVDVGDRISKGQLLIQVDDLQQKELVRQAEARSGLRWPKNRHRICGHCSEARTRPPEEPGDQGGRDRPAIGSGRIEVVDCRGRVATGCFESGPGRDRTGAESFGVGRASDRIAAGWTSCQPDGSGGGSCQVRRRTLANSRSLDGSYCGPCRRKRLQTVREGQPAEVRVDTYQTLSRTGCEAGAGAGSGDTDGGRLHRR